MKARNITKKSISFKFENEFTTLKPGESIELDETLVGRIDGLEYEMVEIIEEPKYSEFDINKDGVVDGSDLNLLSNKVKQEKKKLKK